MKFIVYAKEVSARQWLGRLLNDAGFCREPANEVEHSAVKFVDSVDDAYAEANDSSKNPYVTIVWSSAATAFEMLQLPRLLKNIVVVDQSTSTETFAQWLKAGTDFEYRKTGVS